LHGYLTKLGGLINRAEVHLKEAIGEISLVLQNNKALFRISIGLNTTIADLIYIFEHGLPSPSKPFEINPTLVLL
jgi:hypothetical protein